MGLGLSFPLDPLQPRVSVTPVSSLSRPVLRPADLIRTPVDGRSSVQDFCSPACLTAFNEAKKTLALSCSVCKKYVSVRALHWRLTELTHSYSHSLTLLFCLTIATMIRLLVRTPVLYLSTPEFIVLRK